jgi:hypothetical protein
VSASNGDRHLDAHADRHVVNNVPLHMLVRDLDDELRPKRLPRLVLRAGPPATADGLVVANCYEGIHDPTAGKHTSANQGGGSMSSPTHCLVASNLEAVTHAGVRHEGRRCRPCTGSGHMLYVLPLTSDEVNAIRRAPWSLPEGGGRKTWTLPSGDEIFVSANPGCGWPGTTYRPRTDVKKEADAGPVALEPEDVVEIREAVSDGGAPRRRLAQAAAQVDYLGEREKRWLVRRMAEIVREHQPRFEELTRRLVGDLLRRWTGDGLGPDGVEVEAFWTSFVHLPHTREARGAQATRSFIHEHVVPCCVLRDWLLDTRSAPLSEDEIHAHLDRFCLAALVHKEQDRLLPTSEMPKGWSVTLKADPWARYRSTRLADRRSVFEALVFPRGYPNRPPDGALADE